MRNKPLLFLVVAIPMVAACLVTYLVATAEFRFEWQRHSLPVARNGRAMVVTSPSSHVDHTLNSDSLGSPKAVISEASHDFGTMNPLTMGQHVFTIRNEGDAPLRLKKGPTTCKCTLSSLARNDVLPGQEVQVKLDWNTGRDEFYSHEATIFTSDPEHKQVHLRVHGKVRMQLGMIPKVPRFTNIRPDAPTTTEVVVYSQLWDKFELTSGTASNEGITWEVCDVAPTELDDATAAVRLRITIPAGMASGQLSERIQFAVKPAEADETTLNVPITGKVPRRLAVIGPSVGSDGIVDLGQVYKGESRKKRLLLKVRDEDLELVATRIKCEPDFISANVLPYAGSSKDAGLSTLEIELPDRAPACSFLGVPMGSLRIDFDHPRIQDLELKLKFAVLENS